LVFIWSWSAFLKIDFDRHPGQKLLGLDRAIPTLREKIFDPTALYREVLDEIIRRSDKA
jgi:hypothetical protein